MRSLFALLTLAAVTQRVAGRQLPPGERTPRDVEHLAGNVPNEDFSLMAAQVLPPIANGDIPWVRRLMGDFPCTNLVYRPSADVDGSQLRRVQSLFPEANLWGWPNERLPVGVRIIESWHAVEIIQTDGNRDETEKENEAPHHQESRDDRQGRGRLPRRRRRSVDHKRAFQMVMDLDGHPGTSGQERAVADYIIDKLRAAGAPGERHPHRQRASQKPVPARSAISFFKCPARCAVIADC